MLIQGSREVIWLAKSLLLTWGPEVVDAGSLRLAGQCSGTGELQQETLIRWHAEEEDNTIHLCLHMHTCVCIHISSHFCSCLGQLSITAIFETRIKRKSLLAHMLLEVLAHYQLTFLLLGFWWDSTLWHYVAKQSNSLHGWWERGSQNPKIILKYMPEIIPYFSSPIS